MKIFVAICVLSLMILPAAFGEEAVPANASPDGFMAPSLEEVALSWGPFGGDGGLCGVDDLRCDDDLTCEIACGMACGPLYTGSCVPVGGPTELDTGCECGLATIE